MSTPNYIQIGQRKLQIRATHNGTRIQVVDKETGQLMADVGNVEIEHRIEVGRIGLGGVEVTAKIEIIITDLNDIMVEQEVEGSVAATLALSGPQSDPPTLASLPVFSAYKER